MRDRAKGTMFIRGTTLLPAFIRRLKDARCIGRTRSGLKHGIRPEPLGNHVQQRNIAGLSPVPGSLQMRIPLTHSVIAACLQYYLKFICISYFCQDNLF